MLSSASWASQTLSLAFSRDAAVGGVEISLPVSSLSLHKAFQASILALKADGEKKSSIQW